MENFLTVISSPAAIEELESKWNRKEIHIVTTPSELWSLEVRNFKKVVIDCSVFETDPPWNWMEKVREMFPRSDIWLMLSETDDSLYQELILRLSLDFGMHIIPSGWTYAELPREILSYVFGEKSELPRNGKVMTVMSASPKDGSTTVALSLAMDLAAYTDKRIGLLDLNLKSPEMRDHLNLKGDKGFPVIQTDCDAGDLSMHALLNACHKVNDFENLYVLTGINRREWAEKITNEEIDCLLATSRESFDIVVVDIHTFPDQAATVRAVKVADERIIVAQPVVTSFQSSWQDWFRNVWAFYGMKESDFTLIVNRSESDLITPQKMAKNMGVQYLGALPNIPNGKGVYSVNYGKPVYLTDEEEFSPFKGKLRMITLELVKLWGILVFDEFTPTKDYSFWDKVKSMVTRRSS